jgi:hypothetical protein
LMVAQINNLSNTIRPLVEYLIKVRMCVVLGNHGVQYNNLTNITEMSNVLSA